MSFMLLCRKVLQPLRVVLLILFVCCITTTRITKASSSASSSSSSTYVSVRALDEFGNSIQLQHAREASRRHGRLVVAAASDASNTVVVASLGTKPMVHSVTLPILDEGSESNKGFVSMCCTGIKGDATWLILKVQQQAAKIWERYNHDTPNSGAMAHYVARLLGNFNGEDIDSEWQPSISRKEEGDGESWARPLGVQTMIFSTVPGGSPNILLIEPSGRVMSTKVGDANMSFSSMGKNSDIVTDHFNRLDPSDGNDGKDMDASQLQDMLVKLILEVEANGNNRDGIEILIEILKPTGIDRKILRYDKNGKELAN